MFLTPPKMHTQHKGGHHGQEIKRYSPDLIVVEVWVNCEDRSAAGRVEIEVEFDQYKDRRENTSRTASFEINWNESKLLEPSRDRDEAISSLIFVDYKGSKQAYGGPNLDGVLKIAAEGNGKWRIWAEPPKELQLNNVATPPHQLTVHPRLQLSTGKEDFEAAVSSFKSGFRTFCETKSVFLTHQGWESEFAASEALILKNLNELMKIEITSATKYWYPVHPAFENTGVIILEGDGYLNWRKWYGTPRSGMINLIYFTQLVRAYSAKVSLSSPNLATFQTSLTGSVRGLKELIKWYSVKYLQEAKKVEHRSIAIQQSIDMLELITKSIQWTLMSTVGRSA